MTLDHNKNDRVKLIVDTDPGVDDVLGLLLALSANADILAIVITHGNNGTEKTFNNILKLYQVLEVYKQQIGDNEMNARFPSIVNINTDKKTILTIGANVSDGDDFKTAADFHGCDGLGNISSREDLFTMNQNFGTHPYLDVQTNVAGEDIILNLLKEHDPQTINYAAVAPLSTLANVLRKDEKTFVERIGKVFCMGGAIHVPGNITPLAEFNWYGGPQSVKQVLNSSLVKSSLDDPKFVLLPLDLTTQYTLDFETYRTFIDPKFPHGPVPPVTDRTAATKQYLESFSKDYHQSYITVFTSAILYQILLSMDEKDCIQLHDPLAIWCALNNPPDKPMTDLWKTKVETIKIQTSEEQRGHVKVLDSSASSSANDDWAKVHTIELSKWTPELFRFTVINNIWGIIPWAS